MLLAGAAYLQFSPGEKPVAPFIPAVSSCEELRPGMRRITEQGMREIGEQESLQFEVPVKDFTIHEGCTDAGPIICGFGIRPKNSTAWLSISWGEEMDQTRFPYPNPILDSLDKDKTDKDKTDRRTVLDDKRKPIGGESWGYWGQGERWRRIHLLGWVNARYGSKNEKDIPSYGSVHERDAALFDQIINSACLQSNASD